MEADWEIDIGGDAPVIEAHWPGFVDLRLAPNRAAELTETRRLPGLTDALALLNSHNSPVWTSKTDVFVPDAIDRDELDAPAASAGHRLACYIDVLPRSDQQWITHAMAISDCKQICARLLEIPLRCCRVDLVVRRAVVARDADDHGITAYLSACGATQREAKATLMKCLEAFSQAMVPSSTRTGSKLQ
jgi:hypothetical protein